MLFINVLVKDDRVIFIYEFKLSHNAAEANRNILSVFGDDTAEECTVRKWFEKFKAGDTTLENEELGRPTKCSGQRRIEGAGCTSAVFIPLNRLES